MLQDIFQVALEIDWQSQTVRRELGPLPPVGIAIPNLPLIERLLVKQIDGDDSGVLDLTPSEGDPATMDEEFWHAFHSLDRTQLFESTVSFLMATGKPMTIGELAKVLPPTHDLETLAYWLALARQAGFEVDDRTEAIELLIKQDGWFRFQVPNVQLTHKSVADLDPGSIE